MKTLLRSTFIASPGDNPDLYLRNYMKLDDSGLQFDLPEDVIIWEYVQQFVRAHNHVPDITTLKTHFSRIGEDTVIERLRVLDNMKGFSQGDFDIRLVAKAEERRIREVTELMKDSSTILTTGLEIKKGRDKKILKGPMDAVHYFLEKSHSVVAPITGSRLSGEVTQDGVDFARRYERVEADPLAGIGQHTGLTQIDMGTNGARRFELWIHAAFTGGMKSTWVLNWVYNQAVYHLHSSLLFSLEMPYEQCRNLLYAIHSSHPKFRLIRYFLGMQSTPMDTVGLNYEQIRDGTLDPDARRFLFDYVVPDFNGKTVDVDKCPKTGNQYFDPRTNDPLTCTVDEVGNPYPSSSEYGKIHIEIANPNKLDFSMADLRQKAELVYSKTPFRMIVIDHVSLVSPRKWVSSRTDRDNEVIRDTKKLAMSFNRGEGIAVVALFQVSRDGYRSAMKIKEKTGNARYELTALSYANEAERSADIVTSSWIDEDLIAANRVQFQCLKSRDQKPFEMFLARVEWPCRRMLTCFDIPMTSGQNQAVGDDIDKTVDVLDGIT